MGGLAARVQEMAAVVVAGHWSDGELGVLGGGVVLDGGGLPAKGWMAVRRLGWGAAAPAGVVVSDRVRRIAEEEAARLLRAAVHRRAGGAALLGTWPADPTAPPNEEWSALRSALPDGLDNAA